VAVYFYAKNSFKNLETSNKMLSELTIELQELSSLLKNLAYDLKT